MMRKLCVCTPVYGSIEAASVSFGYHMAVCQMLRNPDISFLAGRLFVNVDLVRARSRALRMFLETDATDLLFWDEDVVPRDINIIHNMIACDKDIVAIPYPRKHLDWEKLSIQVRDESEQAAEGRQTPSELEGAALDWPLRASDEKVINGIARIREAGMGFTLIRRHVVEQMWERYKTELAFNDIMDGRSYPCVALFQVMLVDGIMLSEDFSFCRRWRDMGGEVHCIVDPAMHVGSYTFGKAVGS